VRHVSSPTHYDPARQPAVLRRPVEPGQYTSFAFTRRLKDAGITPSMGTVGDALDNAMCESLIGSMKIELLNRQPWKTIDDVTIAVFEWLEAWYNRRRRHSALGYISPLEYEDQHHDGHQLTNP